MALNSEDLRRLVEIVTTSQRKRAQAAPKTPLSGRLAPVRRSGGQDVLSMPRMADKAVATT